MAFVEGVNANMTYAMFGKILQKTKFVCWTYALCFHEQFYDRL